MAEKNTGAPKTKIDELIEITAIRPIHIASIEQAKAGLDTITDPQVLKKLGEWITTKLVEVTDQTKRYSDKIVAENAKETKDQDNLDDWSDQLLQYGKLAEALKELDSAQVIQLAKLEANQPIDMAKLATEMASGDAARIQRALTRLTQQTDAKIATLEQQLAEAKAQAGANPETEGEELEKIKIDLGEDERDEIEDEPELEDDEENLEVENQPEGEEEPDEELDEEEEKTPRTSKARREKEKSEWDKLQAAIRFLKKHQKFGENILIGLAEAGNKGAQISVIEKAKARKAELQREKDEEEYGEILDILDRNSIDFDLNSLGQFADEDGTVSLKQDEIAAYRTPIIAQLMYMAELGLIKDPDLLIQITPQRQRNSEHALVDLRKLAGEESTLVMQFFTERLKAVETAFPKLSFRSEAQREPVVRGRQPSRETRPSNHSVEKSAAELRARIKERKTKTSIDVIDAATKFGFEEPDSVLQTGSKARDDQQYNPALVDAVIASLDQLSGAPDKKIRDAAAALKPRLETMVLPMLVGLHRAQSGEEVPANFDPVKVQQQLESLLKKIGK